MKQTFNIPAGCKTVSIEEVGNTIVTTFEPEFKKGDFVAIATETTSCNDKGDIGVIYEFCSTGEFRVFTAQFKIKANWHDESSVTFATDSEKQLLLDKMHEAGYDWDAEKCEVVPYRWRPKQDKEYICAYPCSPKLYLETYWDGDEDDHHRWINGLVFKVGEEEKAIEKAKKMLEA